MPFFNVILVTNELFKRQSLSPNSNVTYFHLTDVRACQLPIALFQANSFEIETGGSDGCVNLGGSADGKFMGFSDGCTAQAKPCPTGQYFTANTPVTSFCNESVWTPPIIASLTPSQMCSKYYFLSSLTNNYFNFSYVALSISLCLFNSTLVVQLYCSIRCEPRQLFFGKQWHQRLLRLWLQFEGQLPDKLYRHCDILVV